MLAELQRFNSERLRGFELFWLQHPLLPVHGLTRQPQFSTFVPAVRGDH
jgi:hypothetical protein